ncbi:Major capsid protein Gp23 [compost metagenome]
MGRYQVFIDPFATVDYITVGYRGANAWDAGIYYCPYLPLELYRTVGETTFNPIIGFATRYGVVANPFASHTASGAKSGLGLGQGENQYFRKMKVTNITG